MEIERFDHYLVPISCPECDSTVGKALEALEVALLELEIDVKS